ncbi:MAG TPA: hypothetical protein ENF64_02955 [Hadesarchaea archaeon]|nr:hypothetical protein [Hadesarchaea archaeon]
MRMHAKITCTYADEQVCKAVVAALVPDNLRVPRGLRVSTIRDGKRAVTEVQLDGRVETLLATIDDVLACTLAAESML